MTTTNRQRVRPSKGWRRAAYDMTGGRWNPGLSDEERVERNLTELIRTPLERIKSVAVISLKGGVGKTTTTLALGSMIAENRTDARVLALCVNPDGGSMIVQVKRTSPYTILDLRDSMLSRVLSPVEFDRFVNHSEQRLDTIVSPPTKAAHPLSGQDYQMVYGALRDYYPYKVVFTDCGTNLSDKVMDGVLHNVDQIVVASSTAKSEAAVTVGALDALVKEGREDLVRNALSVIVEKVPEPSNVDAKREQNDLTKKIVGHFQARTRDVIMVPYDEHARKGDIFDPTEIAPKTRRAYRTLAAGMVTALAEAEQGGARR